MSANQKIYIVAIQENDSRTCETARLTVLGACTSLKMAMSKIVVIEETTYSYPVVLEVPIYKSNENLNIYAPDVGVYFKNTEIL